MANESGNDGTISWAWMPGHSKAESLEMVKRAEDGTGFYVSHPSAPVPPSAGVRAFMAERQRGAEVRAQDHAEHNRRTARALQERENEHALRTGLPPPVVSVGGVFGQPLDFIKPGDALPDGCKNLDGSVNSAKLLRVLVPTLSEARAVQLGAHLKDNLVTVEGVRVLIAEHAPGRV